MTIPLFRRLVVESHAYCNRSCWFCGRTGPYAKGRFNPDGTPKKDMLPIAHGKRILKEAWQLGFRGEVALYLYDEPFANPEHQLELAKYAKSLGMKPYVNTNTDYLETRPDLWKAIAATYHKITVSLYDARTNDEAQKLLKLWKGRFGRWVGLSSMASICDKPALEPGKHFDRKVSVGRCLWPLDKLIVAYDGSSPLCCYDIGAVFGLKNALRVPLRDVWFDPKRARIIQALAQGKRSEFALCKHCPVLPDNRIQKGMGWAAASKLGKDGLPLKPPEENDNA